MKLAGNPAIDVCRVGLGRDLHALRLALRYGERWKARHRLCLMLGSVGRRSWWGLWQAEWGSCRRCPRGLTARRVRRKALRQIYSRAMYAVPSKETGA